MGRRSSISKPISDRALEMIMRDVLDGLMEVSLEHAFNGPDCDFEIIEITPSRMKRMAQKRKPGPPLSGDAEIIDFPVYKKVVA